MPDKIKLTLTTPTKLVLEKNADFVVLPSHNGELGVLYGHIDMAVILNPGSLRYKEDQIVEEFVIGEGIAEIKNNNVNIFAQDASLAKEIDEETVRQEIKKLKTSISDKSSSLDPDMASILIKRQLARLKVKSRHR